MTARLDAWPDPDGSSELRALRARLMSASRAPGTHVPPADAEDVVQKALIRFALEAPRPDWPAAEVRARVAYKRERANYFRTRGRKPEELARPEEIDVPVALPDPALIEAAVMLEQIAGADARKLSEVLGQGHSLAHAAEVLHWDSNRVEATRKRIERKKAQIAHAMNRKLKEESDGR